LAKNIAPLNVVVVTTQKFSLIHSLSVCRPWAAYKWTFD